jgi:hypothetical protein
MFFQNIIKRWAELDEMAQDPTHAYISMLLMLQMIMEKNQ